MNGIYALARRIKGGVIKILPSRISHELLRYHYLLKASRGRFASPEPEFARLSEWIAPGSFVIDVGANVGHYTRRMAELAGVKGTVVALEPIPRTFALLSANAVNWKGAEVILLNAAASSTCELLQMDVPVEDGQANYYQARITPGVGQRILAVRLDDIIPSHQRVTLVKIDAEGHELEVLKGLMTTLARDQPRLIVEGCDAPVRLLLESLGYTIECTQGSPNLTAAVLGRR